MPEIRVVYFLEDVFQERILPALVARIAADRSLSPELIDHDLRSAAGGKGTVMTGFRRFVRDVQREREPAPDVLIVAVDGNCQGFAERCKEIEAIAQQAGYGRSLVCAVPDPHIERWYLEDAKVLQQVLKSAVAPQPPPYKCERDRYKQALQQVIADADIFAPLGGAEYGEEIAHRLDLYAVGKADTGFKHFVDGLREALSPFVIAQEGPAALAERLQVPYARRALSPTEIEDRVLAYVAREGKITNAECQRLCDLSPYQASRLLSRLAKEGKLKAVGAGRGRHYVQPSSQ